MAVFLIHVAVTLCVVSSCGTRINNQRTIVIALDGLDPDAVDLLIAEGKMPTFAKLRQEGAYGRLQSMEPMLSPIIWTTVATGRDPADHGIGHFVAVNSRNGEELPVTSQLRRVPALWNIFSDAGRSVDVVGWWATWPAEPVRGTIVSDHVAYHFLFENSFRDQSSDTDGLVYPAKAISAIEPMVTRPSAVTFDEVRSFANVTEDELSRPFAFTDPVQHLRWGVASAQTYRHIGRYLWLTDRPDLEMVYIEATDTISHLFGHLFKQHALKGDLLAQQDRFGETVEHAYILADNIVQDYVDELDENTTLMVLSDHGFKLGQLPVDPTQTRELHRVSERAHAPEGVLYVYGRSVRKGASIKQASVIDIAPTVLALGGLPTATTMPGRVLEDAFEAIAVPPRVSTYEQKVARAGGEDSANSDTAILEHLRSLGYLDSSSPRGDRNLAAIDFEEGRFQTAVEKYQRLVNDNPSDASLRASLAGALGALGRYEDALAAIDEAIKLAPLNAQAHHNRGAILEHTGRTQDALREYAEALKCAPGYAPSMNALKRNGALPDSRVPKTDVERAAFALAQRAQEQARRGDYDAAWQSLDKAMAIAPDYVIVYQYRANVAYLKGDRTAAIDALQRAIELEPENSLFQENIKKLRNAP